MNSEFISTASKLIEQVRLSEAAVILRQALRKRPADWSPIVESEDREIVHSWDRTEFLAYVEHRKRSGVAKPIEWLNESFSQACFLLGWIKVEMGQVIPALYAIEHGIALEPDHPRLLCEKGHILQRMQRWGEAHRYFQRAETARAWAPVAQIAAALRGQGINLIDLGRGSDARLALLKSLVLEPENSNARQELQFISDNLQELEQPTTAVARGDEPEASQQYAICRCPVNAVIDEPDDLMRFQTLRAAVERIAQMGRQEKSVVIRVDKLQQFLGKNLEEAPFFAGRTRIEFDKWVSG